MIHHISKKLIALILAGGIALSHGSFALAKGEEKKVSLPTTTIESSVDETTTEQEIVGLGLTEEDYQFYQSIDSDLEQYATYLHENGIKIVNGEIILETVEQVGCIRRYFSNYSEKKGFSLNNQEVNDLILELGLATISDGLKQQLKEDGRISNPFVVGNTRYILGDMAKVLGPFIKKGEINGFISLLPLISDLKTRQVIAWGEKTLYEYVLAIIKNKVTKAAQLHFIELCDYLKGETTSAPFPIAELDAAGQHAVYMLFKYAYDLSKNSGEILFSDFSHYYASQENQDNDISSVQSYIEVLNKVPTR
jgi:hypothetical protein